MSPLKAFVSDFDELENFCKQLHQVLGDRAILLVQGALGAGKTKTVELLLKQIGVRSVSSPTFALHHEYKSAFFTVDHFDL
jgi:tRNA threonylcarbamoyladenosine biosynthesis protein TsaE